MGWIHKLYETYENCSSLIGIQGPGDKTPLLPIAHSTQNAQVEVVIDGTGHFLRASLVEKGNEVTIIPVTEDSATRSSGIAPHPLCDKLQYVAGDYCIYVDKKKGEEFFDRYMEQLERWCAFEHTSRKVSTVRDYLRQRSLMADLISQKLIVCDDYEKLIKGQKIGTIDQADIFVRFKVEIPGELEPAVWLDKATYDSYVQFYLSEQSSKELCYVTGRSIPCSDKHPAKIRNTGDKAKLISANDTSGFTYRGRFADKGQVVSVGYETSQKAHSALRWLVEKQGYKNGDQVIVSWGTKGQDLPDMFQDSMDTFFGEEEAEPVSTQEAFAERLNHAIAGYGCDLDTTAEIIVMGLDAATTGRLSITYYREFGGQDFLDRVKHWHETCSWKHVYKKVPDGMDTKGKPKFKPVTFVGAPSPLDIAKTAYGRKLSDELKKATVLRILPCITDKAKLPYDLVNSCVNRASSPVSMESWEWQKALTIACALVRKYRYDKFEEEWNMALDENQKDRSYLFGRLLAIAQETEEYAQYIANEKRDTNAERLMHQFKIHPYKTWSILTDKLRPYQSRLGSKGNHLKLLMTSVTSMIPMEDFTSQKKLEDSYLLGYHCQLQDFIEKKKANKKEEGVKSHE